jgi:type IV pilus assembly protein PilY1
MATLLALPSSAGIVLPDEPLTTGARIPPNVLFVLDDSGSMGNDYMPDSIPVVTGLNIASQTYVRNVIYYDPNKEYLPWVDSTGAVMTGGTNYNAAYSHNDLVPPFNSKTINLYGSAKDFYIPKNPANPATFSNVVNYWRYQILTNGVVQRSEWNASAIVPCGTRLSDCGHSGCVRIVQYHFQHLYSARKYRFVHGHSDWCYQREPFHAG